MHSRYKKSVITLLYKVTTNQTSTAHSILAGRRALEAIVTGTGAVAATINVYGCNSNRVVNGILLATITLSGTTSDQGGADMSAEWPYLYAVLTGISGTGAAVTATVGV